ncbi:uncharacterized protein LOC119483338 isoform X1 [Sebastes umbrosus]|uniref:uncharacterized protein LOC119483338 isoform X1 n=1 Tax=Sebastes umbrosus TaxID=72105 RepID=UPI0018A051B2|nr:uncharacterized protein LOC119483338 isoform X1 [Sebastes umbrosus]XP_037617284.1 uncharacterized protein LOC119483338 isoform X1 [Sebastes umbrosus]XP_037617285.1 uncharacterized protein LOC119483338 isoform X1 [Sebastes umbrosus]XP_037617286.1 uncharacterized protein LOC119483338 isoform X1 [Sebastes umbrosus]XP_037617287.1 uncharacterized protein LOC119483338 isoform X1 [Sebastes umbrosus]XP_037617288.1 uncharacterized protein LOC119483338 isoform X1 [Sebastes umbrosus]XP_037617289.1 un
MAEEEGSSGNELEEQFKSLLSRLSEEDSEPFCSDFCKLVEEYASHWQVPLPRLRILEIALRYFAGASTLKTNCDHVSHTVSSLALSVFELLLFFDQKDFHQEPLKHFAVTFQECNSALARHQNVHLLQVERLVRGGGPWAGPALQAILSESSLPQSEVDGCISSELPVFFELRVHYLLSCERVSEAMALAKCCAAHPTAGQHLFFLQVYLTWLFKTSQHDRLHKEVAEFNGKDAVHIICSLECEETDELLLALSRAFLSQQLLRGDMYYLYDLVFIWSKLHSRLNTSKQALLEESHQLMLSATNVNSIFPFIRDILQEPSEDGIEFCVELCANALGSCRPCDVITKSLIYKTIAGLLPNDLEVSRVCALLVFFLERTVESYKMLYLLYMPPDQEYHVEYSPIRNHIRFETLQFLKKDLCFDPEFWNLIALRTNCLKLMSETVVSDALEEIMEDKWILSYCTKEPAFRSRASVCQKARKKRHHEEDSEEDADSASRRLKVGPGRPRLNVDHTIKKKGNRGSSSEPLRRSFWQQERLQDNGELRRTTRLSEKNLPKRRIMKPKWLLEDSGTLGENNVIPKIKKHGLKHQKDHASSVEKRSETGELKNNANHNPSVNSHLMARENNSKHRRGFSLESPKPAASPQVILELSLPDNELMGTFTEDACNRQRGFPQVLLYRPTLKVPAASQSLKTVQRKLVILRARDAAMFAQQLHCYALQQKGKGNTPNIQGSVSTITRSSVQGSPPKDPLCEKPAAEVKGGFTSQTPAAAEATKSPVLQAQTTKAVSQKTFSGRELSEKSSVEMKVTNASQTSAETDLTEAPMVDKVLHAPTVTSVGEFCEEPAVEMKVTIASTAANVTPSPGLDKVSKAVKDAVEVSQTSTEDNDQMVVTDKISNIGAADSTPSQSQDVLKDGKQDLKSLSSQAETVKNPVAPEVLAAVSNSISEVTDVSLSKGHVPCKNDTSGGTVVTTSTPTDQDSINDISALTLVTEMVTELAPEALARDLENHKAPEGSSSKGSTAGSKSKAPRKLHSRSSCSIAADVQGKEEGTRDVAPETPEDPELPESEESKVEYCTFCNKDFKGSRLVPHALFHYRKDECMFCGVMFNDNILAMRHLSDHIEKLKRSKDSAGNNAQENCVFETKDISTSKTSAKAKTTNVSSGRRSRGRPRKSTHCPKSLSLPESNPSGSRQLRSSGKPVDQPLREKKENALKHLDSKTPVHKINGHIGKKKELDRPKKDALKSEAKRPLKQQEISQKRAKDGAERLQENQDVEMESPAASASVDKGLSSKATESVQVLKKTTKRKVVEEKNLEPQEKLCCPVEGCGWSTDPSKNRVAVLYHALDDHYGEVKPLELAFRVGNSKCNSCMRVMLSFEHFQHHVEIHRLLPRHPCLHQGCTARFKSGPEMRRHTRRHSPLQAVCCLPGCSQLFICLWALNLHEREHYTAKPTKPDKNTNEQTGDKQDNTPNGKKQPDRKPEDATVNKTASVKDARKLRGEASHNSTGKHVQAPLPTTVSASPLKEESKERNETKDSHVLKNLSNKDTSAQPTGPNLRLRQKLRKVTNTIQSHKVISSSLKRNNKVRHKVKEKQVKVNTKSPKRRGRPPKSKEAVHDENTTAGQNNQTVVVEKTALLVSPPKAEKAESSTQSGNSAPDVPADGLNVRTAPPTTSGEKKSALEKKSKSVDQQVEAKAAVESSPDMEGEAKEGGSIPAATASGLNEPTSKERTQKKKKASQKRKNVLKEGDTKIVKKKRKVDVLKEGDTKIVKKKRKDDVLKEGDTKIVKKKRKHDVLKEGDTKVVKKKRKDDVLKEGDTKIVKKKRKDDVLKEGDTKIVKKKCKDDVLKEGDTKIVKEKCKDEGVPPAKTEPLAEVNAEVVESPGCSVVMNGQAAKEDVNSTAPNDALPEDRPKPYMRLPPTAYLDEKYITMPKRRKELSFFQRCSHCFATFSSAEELESHLQLQTCSNLFGFDSDDEGSSLTY